MASTDTRTSSILTQSVKGTGC